MDGCVGEGLPEKSKIRAEIEKMSSIKVSRRRKILIRNEEENIPLAEFYKKIRRTRRPISLKKKSSPAISRKEDENEKIHHSSPPVKKKEFRSESSSQDPETEEDSEEEKRKYLSRSPVVVTDLKEHLAACRLRVLGTLGGFGAAIIKREAAKKPEEPEPESEEELLLECDRKEVDLGYNYVLRKRWRAITNTVSAKKIYYKRSIDPYPTIEHVLHDPEYPMPTLSKLALQTYNEIQGTHYEYVGLVKAYARRMSGYYFDIRFKARLLGQDAINFQASGHHGIPNRKAKVRVQLEGVYPLRI